MRRDHNCCRFRFSNCRKRATQIVLDVPEFLGGPNIRRQRSSCLPGTVADQQRQQRTRAAELFNYFEGW